MINTSGIEPFLIGITGATRSGKSSSAKHLRKELTKLGYDVTFMGLDKYFKSRKSLPRILIDGESQENWETFDALDLALIESDWDSNYRACCQKAEQGVSMPILIVEGFLLLGLYQIVNKLNVLVFLNLDYESCFERRCLNTQGRTTTDVYFNQVVWPEYCRQNLVWLDNLALQVAIVKPYFLVVNTVSMELATVKSTVFTSVVHQLNDTTDLAPDPRHIELVRKRLTAAYTPMIVVREPVPPVIPVPEPPFEPGSLRDSVLGMFIMHAYGDAAGAPFEFNTNGRDPYDGVFRYQPRSFNRFQGWRNGSLGQPTDDTAMTIALLSKLRCKNSTIQLSREMGLTPQETLQLTYIDWANKPKVNCKGRNTRAMLTTTAKTNDGRLRAYRNNALKHASDGSKSNGSLMRCAPYALFPEAEWEAALKQDCEITHSESLVYDTCHAYIELLRHVKLATTSADLSKLIQEMLHAYSYDNEVVQVLLAPPNAERDVTVNKGHCLHGLWCAVQSLHRYLPTAADAQNAITWIVNLGGDTDTNAAIAGALLGVRIGYAALYQNTQIFANLQTMLNSATEQTQIYYGGYLYHPLRYFELVPALFPAKRSRDNDDMERPPSKRSKRD